MKGYILKKISVSEIGINENKFYLNILFLYNFVRKILILIFKNCNLRIAERLTARRCSL